MTFDRICAEVTESLNEILETAKLVHGERTTTFAHAIADAKALGELIYLATHAACGTEVHEQALKQCETQVTSLLNHIATALTLNETQLNTAVEISASLAKQITQAQNRIRKQREQDGA